VYEARVRTAAEKKSHDPASLHLLTPYVLAAPRRYSLAFVGAVALVVLFLPQRALMGVRPVKTEVAGVRAIDGVVLAGEEGAPAQLDVVALGDAPRHGRAARLMLIDGNRNGDAVLFDHEAHFARTSGVDSCAACHHLNMPLDRNSSCSECHRDMYEPTDVFEHATHVARLGGNDGCVKCHADPATVKTRLTATACDECHAEEVSTGSFVAAPEKRWRAAVGYMDGMHALCVECHRRSVEEMPAATPHDLARCDACHDTDVNRRIADLAPAPEEPTRVSAVDPRR
jgi:hypothetical protein